MSIQRCYDVFTTSITLGQSIQTQYAQNVVITYLQRRTNVKRTLCTYWKYVGIMLSYVSCRTKVVDDIRRHRKFHKLYNENDSEIQYSNIRPTSSPNKLSDMRVKSISKRFRVFGLTVKKVAAIRTKKGSQWKGVRGIKKNGLRISCNLQHTRSLTPLLNCFITPCSLETFWTKDVRKC